MGKTALSLHLAGTLYPCILSTFIISKMMQGSNEGMTPFSLHIRDTVHFKMSCRFFVFFRSHFKGCLDFILYRLKVLLISLLWEVGGQMLAGCHILKPAPCTLGNAALGQTAPCNITSYPTPWYSPQPSHDTLLGMWSI